MTKGYNELVGLQVTFNHLAPEYTMVHYYRWTQDGVHSPTVIMHGYPLSRTETEESVIDGLRKAYAPAIMTIWLQETEKTEATYFQFQVAARPDELSLAGDWTIVEQW